MHLQRYPFQFDESMNGVSGDDSVVHARTHAPSSLSLPNVPLTDRHRYLLCIIFWVWYEFNTVSFLKVCLDPASWRMLSNELCGGEKRKRKKNYNIRLEMQMMTAFKLNGDSVCVMLIIHLLHDNTPKKCIHAHSS